LNGTNAILRNQSTPTLNGQYSSLPMQIILKKSASGFQYMIEATAEGVGEAFDRQSSL
jgi:hypothetical protein